MFSRLRTMTAALVLAMGSPQCVIHPVLPPAHQPQHDGFGQVLGTWLLEQLCRFTEQGLLRPGEQQLQKASQAHQRWTSRSGDGLG